LRVGNNIQAVHDTSSINLDCGNFISLLPIVLRKYCLVLVCILSVFTHLHACLRSWSFRLLIDWWWAFHASGASEPRNGRNDEMYACIVINRCAFKPDSNANARGLLSRPSVHSRMEKSKTAGRTTSTPSERRENELLAGLDVGEKWSSFPTFWYSSPSLEFLGGNIKKYIMVG
jgi:hypothetical protein